MASQTEVRLDQTPHRTSAHCCPAVARRETMLNMCEDFVGPMTPDQLAARRGRERQLRRQAERLAAPAPAHVLRRLLQTLPSWDGTIRPTLVPAPTNRAAPDSSF